MVIRMVNENSGHGSHHWPHG